MKADDTKKREPRIIPGNVVDHGIHTICMMSGPQSRILVFTCTVTREGLSTEHRLGISAPPVSTAKIPA